MTATRLPIVDAVNQSIRRKSSEHHGMCRSDSRTGEQGDGDFGVAHVDGNPVAFLDPKRLQHVGELFAFAIQLRVRVRVRTLRPVRPPRSARLCSFSRFARGDREQL